MKFVLFVEGETEAKALPDFLSRWLNPILHERVGIATVNFKSCAKLVKEAPERTLLELNSPKNKGNVIAVIALLDIYGLELPYPKSKQTVAEKYEWAKQHLEKRVNHPKFRQYFAVHESEAWLLSDSAIFPVEIAQALAGKAPEPEKINFQKPPAKLLEELYLSKLKRKYIKPTDSVNGFSKLDPAVAYDKCPYLKEMLDDMLQLAQEAGL